MFVLKHQHTHTLCCIRCFHARLMLLCCVCFKTYSVVQRFNIHSKLRLSPSSSSHFVVQCWQALSIAGWKIKRIAVVCVHTSAKHEVAVKKTRSSVLKYDSSVYLPDFLLFSSFRIFSPLCCCSRVRPVEFFHFSLSRLIYENGFFTISLMKKKKNSEARKTT